MFRRSFVYTIAALALSLGLSLGASPASAAPAKPPCTKMTYPKGTAFAPKQVQLTCGRTVIKVGINPRVDVQERNLPAVRKNITVDSIMWESRINKLSVWYTDSRGTVTRRDDASWLVTRNLTSQRPNRITTVPVQYFGD